MATVKKAKVKRTKYSSIVSALALWNYIGSCLTTGMDEDLFKDPNILAAFYALGTLARAALKDAMDAYVLAPTDGNRDVIVAKMALVVIWLDGYSDKVEVISNSDTKRTTYEEAVANVRLSFLTVQKATGVSKGKPNPVEFTAKEKGSGNVLCEVTNGDDDQPTSTTFLAVELPTQPTEGPYIPDPLVTLDGDQINVVAYSIAHVVSINSNGKGLSTLFKSLKRGKRYAIYAYSQNGKKYISNLSAPVIVSV